MCQLIYNADYSGNGHREKLKLVQCSRQSNMKIAYKGLLFQLISSVQNKNKVSAISVFCTKVNENAVYDW